MAIAVALGVWFSVQISIGDVARTNPSFTWWVVNRLAYLVGVVNLSTFTVYFLQGRLGLVGNQAAGPAANLLLVLGILILIFALVSGWLADRFGHKRLVATAGIVAALGVGIAVAVPNLIVIAIGAAFIGAATGMFYTANWALGTSLVPKAEAGRYLGISNLAGAGAGAVGAYIGGPIADFFTVNVPSVPGLGYVLLFAIYGVMFLFSVVALARVK
jgi:MFS family permease